MVELRWSVNRFHGHDQAGALHGLLDPLENLAPLGFAELRQSVVDDQHAGPLDQGPRQRDGATCWRIYRDLDDPTRYVERFIVTSWAAYLHQRARATVADQALEARLLGFLAEGERVAMQHYVAER